MTRSALIGMLFLLVVPAQAQVSTQGVVVSACGTPPVTYTLGRANAPTLDTTGKLCAETTCSAPPVTYVAGQTYPILVDTNGKTCTSGG